MKGDIYMKIKKIIICLLLTMLISLGTTSLAKSEQDMAEAQSVIQDAERSFELMELRENNSKTYLLKDGTYEYVGYAEDIHYKDADGKLKEIDNAITDKPRKDGYTYSNTANAWHTYFAECLCKKNAVVIEKDDYKITFSMVDAKTQSRAMKSSALDKSESIFDKVLACDNRAVVYKDAMKNVDVAYTVTTCGLKEDILLRNASATNIFKFDFTLDGLSVFEKEGIVSFVNGGGEHIFELAPMYMEDANGKYCDKVSYTIEENHDSYILTIIADKEFLNAPDTQFPVIIDPSIMITGATDTFDTYVDQEYPTKNYYLATAQWTGGQYGINAMRTYIKFNLPTNIPAANISSAYLRIERISYAAPTIKAYRVTGNWASSSVTWNNKPGYTSTYASATAYNDSGNWYRMNATTMVKHWIDGVYSNYGFVLKEPSESDTNQKTRFYSSDASSPHKPELHIVFSSYDYYGNRAYEFSSGSGQNCMGYALNYPDFIDFYDLGMSHSTLNGYTTTSQLLNYTKSRSENWMNNHVIGYNSLSSYNSYIYSNQYRVVLRVGYEDLNGNNQFDWDSGWGDLFDYHWWYQTSTGQWAEKPGSTYSRLIPNTSGNTNPYYVTWDGYVLYNSACVYYGIDN